MSVPIEKIESQKTKQQDIEKSGLKELFSELKKDGLKDDKLPEVYQLVKNIKSINPEKGIYLLLGQIREVKTSDPKLDFNQILKQILEQEKVEVERSKKITEDFEQIKITPRQLSSLLERINEAREKREEAKKQKEIEEAKLDSVGSMLRKRTQENYEDHDIIQEKQTPKIDDKMSKEEMAHLVLDSFIYHAGYKNFDYEKFKENLKTEDKKWLEEIIDWLTKDFSEGDQMNPKEAIEKALAEFDNQEDAPKYLVSLTNEFIISKIAEADLREGLSSRKMNSEEVTTSKRKLDEETILTERKKRNIETVDLDFKPLKRTQEDIDLEQPTIDKKIRIEDNAADVDKSSKIIPKNEKKAEFAQEKPKSTEAEIASTKDTISIQDTKEWLKNTSKNWQQRLEKNGEKALGKKWTEEAIKQEINIQSR